MVASEDTLKQVMADVLGVEAGAIGENTSVDTLPAWDSLNHMKLVLALESEFDIAFSGEESVQILSYPLIRAVLAERGVVFV